MDNCFRSCVLRLTLACVVLPAAAGAQVGIGTATPDASAVLELSSTNRGLLLPRLTTAQRDAIASPANGLVVYNTTTGAINVYNGAWTVVGGGSSGWGLTGNAGTTPGTNFIGTTDNQALEIWVNSAGAANTGARRVMRYVPNGTSANLIGGHNSNSVTGGVFGATVAGGGADGANNQVAGNFGTVSGGNTNTVGAARATVAGGNNNTASGVAASIGGGTSNVAGGDFSAIPGGSALFAPSYGETAVGLNNTNYIPASATAFNAADRVFSVGIGASAAARANAIEVFKTGNIRFNSLSGPGALQVNTAGDVGVAPRIAFSALLETNSNFTGGTERVLDFDFEEYDLGGGYTPATGTFQAPVAGVYHFDISLQGQIFGTNESASLYVVNQATLVRIVSRDLAFAGTDPNPGMQVSFDLQLAAGQRIQIRFTGSSNGYFFTSGGYNSRFSGHLVFPS